jgi:hypothetical protein
VEPILRALVELHRACSNVAFPDDEPETFRVHLSTVAVNALKHALVSGYIETQSVHEMVDMVLNHKK